jgi:hypothetical protein
VLSSRERRNVELKALEQALREAELARIAPEPLLPTCRGLWPFALTQDDRDFLKIQKISPA